MKRLTREEADDLQKRPDGRISWFRGLLLGMRLGDIILLEPNDWKQKRAPKTVIRRMTGMKKRRWKCETVLNNRGWVIERLS
jgi:hypothetical protein